MQIELIGPTGAGKTTFAQTMHVAAQQQGIDLISSYSFMLRWARLDWLGARRPRMAALNLLAFITCLVAWRQYRPILRCAWRVVSNLPASVAYSERMHIGRLVLRNVGIDAVVSRYARPDQLILADEGLLHIAHHLFVHRGVKPDRGAIEAFVSAVRLPDVVIYLRQPQSLLVERTQARGHKRIPSDSPIVLQQFIEGAVTTFETIAADPALGDRLAVIERGDVVIPPSATRDPAVVQVMAFLCAAVAQSRRQKRAGKGAVIAFVGPEATGKSTMVARTGRWLGDHYVTRTVHVGKPPSTWLTAPVNVGLPLLRRCAAGLRTTRLERSMGDSAPQEMARPQAGYKALVYAIRAVLLAWDRRCSLVEARRAAGKGEVVICDRYPSEAAGAMDSARLSAERAPAGVAGSIYRRLARIEARLYSQIPPPDIVLRLHVSLETARQRNRDRIKWDKEGDAYIEARHRQCREWRCAGPTHVFDIDTERPLEETIVNVQQTIWHAL